MRIKSNFTTEVSNIYRTRVTYCETYFYVNYISTRVIKNTLLKFNNIFGIELYKGKDLFMCFPLITERLIVI